MALYAKLFTSIYQGTLRGNSHGLLVFTNMLAHCDKAGVCDMHPRAISEEVGLTVEQVRAALDELEGPDDESRSPEEGGRRIVRLDEHRAWGWRVVNYLKYRAIRDEEDRREQNKRSQEAWRLRQQKKHESATVSQGKPGSAHTEAEVEKDISTPSGSHPPAKAGGNKAPTIPCPYTAIVALYHEVLPSLPRCKLMPPKRQAALRKIWGWVLGSRKSDGTRRAETAAEALEWLKAYFERASDNDFLMGRGHRSDDHAGWQCSLDFLLTDKGMTHVIERTQEHAA